MKLKEPSKDQTRQPLAGQWGEGVPQSFLKTKEEGWEDNNVVWPQERPKTRRISLKCNDLHEGAVTILSEEKNHNKNFGGGPTGGNH